LFVCLYRPLLQIGFRVSTIWEWPSIGPCGQTLRVVQKHFVSTMIIIGIGVYWICLTIALKSHSRCSIPKPQGFSTSVIGKCRGKLSKSSHNVDLDLLDCPFLLVSSGVHHKKKTCDPATAAAAIDRMVTQYQSLLFPETFSVEILNAKKLRLKKGNGGWGDIRDHQLCLSF